MPLFVELRLQRAHAFREADSLLQGLDDLLVVQAVGRGVLEPLPVDDGHPSPGAGEAREVGGPAGGARGRALGLDHAPVLQPGAHGLRLLGIDVGQLGRQALVDHGGALDRSGLLGGVFGVAHPFIVSLLRG